MPKRGPSDGEMAEPLKKKRRTVLQGSEIQEETSDNIMVDERSSIEKALSISLILRLILSSLNTRVLLRMRLVSKSWEQEARIPLLSIHRKNKIIFKLPITERGRLYKSYNKLGNLEQFSKLYDKPFHQFPCSHFSFELASSSERKAPVDVFNFLSKSGSNISRLTLSTLHNCPGASQMLRKIIFDLTPNLHTLTLELDSNDCGFKHGSRKEKKIGPVLKQNEPLTNLQELYFGTGFEFNVRRVPVEYERLVQDIFKSAPNLKRILDPKLRFTEEMKSSGKIGAVYSLNFCIDGHTVTRFVECSQGRPQLTVLHLDVLNFFYTTATTSFSSFICSLQLILESSKKTLVIFHFRGRLDLEDPKFQINVPVMENLEEFRLDEWAHFGSGRGLILPPGFSLQRNFPKLKILTLAEAKIQEPGKKGVDPFFQDANSSTTVEQLTIYFNLFSSLHLDPTLTPQIRTLYPNVRILHLLITHEFFLPEFCTHIFKSWSQYRLEELKLTLHCLYGRKVEEGFVERMDVALTGFDLKTCKMLRQQLLESENLAKEEEMPEFQRDASLLDMKTLKFFQIAAEVLRPFSRVSLAHAFEPMKKRQKFRAVINGIDFAHCWSRFN